MENCKKKNGMRKAKKIVSQDWENCKQAKRGVRGKIKRCEDDYEEH